MLDNECAQFTAMEHSTAEDWAIIARHSGLGKRGLPDRLLTHLALLDGDTGGYAIDRLEHSLQTATRAFRDERDEVYVVAALLHDIGDTLASFNHPEMAAALLRPFVSPELHWVIEKHGVFQGYFYFDVVGLDRDMREQYRGHPHFEACAEFCYKYDQCSFDPNYDSAPIEFFAPMVKRVMSKPVMPMFK